MEKNLESMLEMLIRCRAKGVLSDNEVVTSTLYGLISDLPLPRSNEMVKCIPKFLHSGLSAYLNNLRAINYEWQPPVIGRDGYGKYDLAERLLLIHKEIDAMVYE